MDKGTKLYFPHIGCREIRVYYFIERYNDDMIAVAIEWPGEKRAFLRENLLYTDKKEAIRLIIEQLNLDLQNLKINRRRLQEFEGGLE